MTSLLNALSSGEFFRDQLLTECNMDCTRFHKPLKNPVMTFASLKKKTEKIGQKVHEVKLQRDLFGRLLTLSLDKNLDLEKVLCFPITPVPLSLCHIDGSMIKTVKSVLIQELEKKLKKWNNHHKSWIFYSRFFFLFLFKYFQTSAGQF